MGIDSREIQVTLRCLSVVVISFLSPETEQLSPKEGRGETATLSSSLRILLLFSHSIMSGFLVPQGLQHTSLLCPSPSPGVCSNSCPLSRWCHPTIASSAALFSCPQSFPASGSYLNRWLALRIRWPRYWSFSFSISPSNEHSGLTSFRIDWFDLAVQGTLKSLLQHS